MLTRRAVLTGISGLALTACAHRADALRIPAASARRRIEDLVYSAMVPAAGLVVSRRGEIVFAHTEGRAQGAAGEAETLPFRPDTPMRVADVSRLATALTAHRLAQRGTFDLPADGDVFEAPTRLAALMEAATAERFDRLATREVFRPLGLDAGFKGSGMSATRRRRGATLYQRETEGKWQVSADGPEILAAETSPPEGYVPGTNGALFDPAGGLRASLLDIEILARAAAELPGAPAFAADASPIPGIKLIGQLGAAHGLYCGAFYAPGLDAGIAFAVTGTAEDGTRAAPQHPAMVEATLPLWAAAEGLLASF